MMLNYEKRFPEDFELQAQFLELVNYVYRFGFATPSGLVQSLPIQNNSVTILYSKSFKKSNAWFILTLSSEGT